jgi:hypothetical protein
LNSDCNDKAGRGRGRPPVRLVARCAAAIVAMNGQRGDLDILFSPTPPSPPLPAPLPPSPFLHHLSGIASAVAIASGIRHTCAIITGGGAMCWGNNNAGQLGIGSNIEQDRPMDVAGKARVTQACHMKASECMCVCLWGEYSPLFEMHTISWI